MCLEVIEHVKNFEEFIDYSFKCLNKNGLIVFSTINRNKISYITYRFGTISGVSKGMRFHTAINKFCLSAALNKPLPIWRSMMNKPRPYLSLKDAFKVFKFTIEKDFFTNEIYNILSQHLTLKKIISYFRKYKKQLV